MPAELFGPDFRFLPRSEVLSFEEIRDLARIFAALGVRRFRITGGEPLLRRELDVLVSQLRGIDKCIDLSITTNGTRLEGMAQVLKNAGLDRVNVSMDAVERESAINLAGREVDPEATWRAVLAARDAGLATKVNMVVKRGLNEDQVVPLALRCRQEGIPLRFIEYMDVGTTNAWSRNDVVTGASVRELLASRWPLRPAREHVPGETARRYLYDDGAGEVGFINSVSQPFCSGCNRARISAEGMLYTCLFSANGVSLKKWIREEKLDAQEIADRLRRVWELRDDRYSERRSMESGQKAAHRPEMWTVGG